MIIIILIHDIWYVLYDNNYIDIWYCIDVYIIILIV